jgi:hypothetical protein
MALSFFANAPTSALTSGARNIQAYLQINGANIPVLQAEANLTSTRETSTIDATVALDWPGCPPDTFWASPQKIDASLYIVAGNQKGTPWQNGQIIHVDIDYEQRLVHVHGQDGSSQLHLKKASQSWINQTPAQIVSQLVGMAGLTPVANGLSTLAGKLFQIDTTKIANDESLTHIIHKLAEFEGARWWVNGSNFYYQPPGQSTGQYPVIYSAPQNGGPASGNFKKLSVKVDKTLESAACTVTGWNQKQAKTISSTKSAGSGNNTTQYNYENHNLTQEQADQFASSKLSDIMRHQVTINVEMVGDPTIDIGQQLSLTGTAVDGSYTMDSIRHSIRDHGYSMDIDAKGQIGGN